MATAFHDRVRETGTGTSGAITLLGAVAQYQAFSVVGNGNSCRYTVVDADGAKWGTFSGVWSTGGSLSRVVTHESSNGVGVAVTFSAGTHQVFLTPDAKALYDQAPTQVLYNNAGLLAGHANFTFDPTMPGDILVRVGPPESTLDPLLHSYTDGQLLVTKLNGNGSGVGVEYETSTGNCNGFYFAGLANQANSDNGAFEGDCYIGANGARFYNYGTYNEVLPGIAADAIYGFWQPFPVTLGAGSSLNLFVANWVGDMAGSATNIYYFWADSRGVYRIREDNVADGSGNPQAIPSLYNPRFTKYTAGAADYERIVQQWVANVATIGAEAGGTGALRALNLIGSSIKANGSIVLVSAGALGTPSSGTLTSCTGLPAAGVVGTAAILGANTFTGAQLVPAGLVSAVGLGFSGDPDTGFYERTTDRITVATGGVAQTEFVNGNVVLNGIGLLQWVAGNTITGAGTNTFLGCSGTAAVIQQGQANAASPVAQTLQAQGSRSGTDSNVAGANYTMRSGVGTGTGTLSSLILQAPIAVASGTGAQTQTTGFVIKAGGAVLTSYTVANLPAAGTIGAGGIAFVTDALAPVALAAVTGGGAVKVPVYSDGSAWNAM